MIAKGVTRAQAEQAAKAVGVRLFNLRDVKGGVGFTLKTGEQLEPWTKPRGEAEVRGHNTKGRKVWRAKYRRLSMSRHEPARSVPGAVCWHGHRDFLRELFRLAPDADVKTAFIRYRGADDFEERHESTWDGAPKTGAFVGYMRPYQDACTCEE